MTQQELESILFNILNRLNNLESIVDDLYKNQTQEWAIIEDECLTLNKTANK